MTNEELVREITEVSQREKSNSHRIDEIENDIKDLQESNKAIYQINTNLEKMCMSLAYTNEKLDENTQDIKTVKKEIAEVKAEPNRQKARWIDTIIQLAIAAIAGGIIGFVLNAISPTIWG